MDPAMTAHIPDRSSPARLTVRLGIPAATVAVAAGLRVPGAAFAVEKAAVLVSIAVWFHYLLALPGGRLDGVGRRIAAGLGYACAAAAGLGLAAAGTPLHTGTAALIWVLATLLALPAVRLRYVRSAGHDKERIQWLGVGLVAAAGLALIAAVLHLLVGWPARVGAVAAGAALAVPLCLALAEWRPLAPYGGRVLVRVLSLAGASALVAACYLVIVAGLGMAPDNSTEREILGLSVLAAAVAAMLYLTIRGRLAAFATRFVYGAREAPDQVLRTFGSRMTRAVAMDELLLQLAESLRKTMDLTRAEIYTGGGDVLERTVSVPDAGSGSIVLTDRERPVVASAGVSGSAWAAVWLPALLDGRERAQLRVAPISHAGELLGLIVVERPARADAFTEEDDRVLTELAREAGLAFHNASLDAALQTTLDALRKQAGELRESRARIVASGDAERRRVERDLHDGAQQHLVALAINLRLARDIVTEDPAAADEMLGQMADDVQLTIKELRELAHGIYPPLLADGGLGDALRAAASRSPLTVHVRVDDGVGRYPSEVEAAVYFSCLEALQNAAKHAQGATVELRVWAESGGLLFAVTDDGPGFDPQSARGGHGFVNMSDRLGAVGGAVRWDSGPGKGATISGSVPLET
jgi:signal transduction histidine kinase